MHDTKIVVTKASALCSTGASFESLKNGLPAEPRTGSVKKYDFHEFDTDVPCFPAAAFDAEQLLGKKGLRTKDWSTKLLLSALELGFKGRFEVGAPENKAGICVGTAFGSVQSIGDFLSDSIVNGVNNVNPMLFANTVINSPTGNANIRYEVRALSTTVATGFNAGADAVVYACDYIKRGYLSAIVAGGLEELSYYGILGMQRTGALSASGRMMPFGRNADGFLAGEGCAMFLLETEESARTHGETVIATIAGYASAFDPATTMGVWSPDAARHVMKAACQNAGIAVSDIGFIAASANGTKAGDAMEARAIADVFGKTPVTAYKSRTGECYAASSALSIACALADLQSNRITGLPAGYETDSTIQCITGVLENRNDRYAMINSFSCDGNCTSIIIKKEF